MFKQIAFGLGVAVGLFNLVSTVSILLTYYFTGRIPAVTVRRARADARRSHFHLLTMDDVIGQAQAQMRRRFAGR